jgi:hypothetical protein
MLSRDQYGKLISAYFVELNHLIRNVTDEDLAKLPGFSKEIDEYLPSLRDPSLSPSQVLYTAFAFVDEYASAADKSRAIDAGYEAYKIMHARQEL